MNLEDITIGQLKELRPLLSPVAGELPAHPYIVGEKYFVRTVTHHYTGRLKAVYAGELVFSDAAWIADDGRFSETLVSGDHAEIEPFPAGVDVIVSRGAICDCSIYQPDLPLSKK